MTSILQMVQDEWSPVIMSNSNACLGNWKQVWCVTESVSFVWHLNFMLFGFKAISQSAWVICYLTPPARVDLFNMQISCLKCHDWPRWLSLEAFTQTFVLLWLCVVINSCLNTCCSLICLWGNVVRTCRQICVEVNLLL